MDQVYLDTETCGLHGMPVILQYAINDGPIEIHEFWNEPISKTLELIEQLCTMEVVGFNLAFDWFHINKVYNVFRLYADRTGNPEAIPADDIEGIACVEKDARDGVCVKPASALDLMLYFRKTKLQITMERDDIRVRRVPLMLAGELAKVLTQKIRLDPILFANQKKWAPRFQVEDVKDEDGDVHPTLKNVVLRFKPGGSLKALATHLLGKKVVKFGEVELSKKLRPKEYGYAPFAEAIGKPGAWKWTWPDVIKFHINHWANRDDARAYAKADVDNTRGLHEYAGKPDGGDTDSILACCVAACRWKGYNVDIPKLEQLIKDYKAKLKAPMAPSHVKSWINELLTPLEQAMIWRKGTSKKALQEIVKEWGDTHPELVERCKAVLEARKAKKKIEVLEKLRIAGRFHASFKVIGALSGRMSGADKLNAQGIDKTKEVRGCFPLAFLEEVLMGGDMKSFEISIAAADYGDPQLAELLTTCEEDDTKVVLEDGVLRCPTCIRTYGQKEPKCDQCGLGLAFNEKGEPRCNYCYGAECKSFHALFGMGFYPEMTYKEIRESAGKKTGNVYNPCKNGAFATLYGAQPAKLADTIGVSEEQAIEGYHRFWRTFEVAGAKRREVELAFTSLYSEGVGGRIDYRVPEEAIESLLGYKRFFTLENYLIKELYDLANNLPKSWKDLKIEVERSRKGPQKIASAIRSAIYACAFSLQNGCIRQAANHRIQSTGAGVTKETQAAIWTIQPAGCHSWIVRPMNIHDELQTPTHPDYCDQVVAVVKQAVEKFRPLIPLIGIDFGRLSSWADK